MFGTNVNRLTVRTTYAPNVHTPGVAKRSEVALALKRLREEARPKLSMEAVAKELGMPRRSSYAYYEDSFKGGYLPGPLVKRLIPVFERHKISRARERLLAMTVIPGQSPEDAEPMAERGNGRDPSPRTLPVYGNIGGSRGEEINFNQEIRRVVCPDYLLKVPEAFALEVHGDSMEPRYYAGETVYCNPRRAPARNKFVAIERHNGLGVIKQYVVQDGDKIRLRQFNPPKEFTIPTKEIKQIVRVVGNTEE